MKYCNDYAALLDLYVDGELAAEDMIRVQEHLEQCPGCRAYVDAAFAMRSAFPDAEDTTVPDGFTESVMAAVRLSPRQRRRRTPWVKILTPLAACCAIVILLQSGSLLGGAEKGSRAENDAAAPESAMFDMAYASKEEALEVADYASGSAVQNESKTSSSAVEDGSPAEAEAPMAPAGGTMSPDENKEDPSAAPTRYATTIRLPAECLEFLKDEVPTAEFTGEIHYELDQAAYDTLQAQLKDRGILFPVELSVAPTTEAILVIVEK